MSKSRITKERNWFNILVSAWLAWVAVAVLFWGTVIYVIVHFLLKFW